MKTCPKCGCGCDSKLFVAYSVHTDYEIREQIEKWNAEEKAILAQKTE